jgi:hypothetical protein
MAATSLKKIQNSKLNTGCWMLDAGCWMLKIKSIIYPLKTHSKKSFKADRFGGSNFCNDIRRNEQHKHTKQQSTYVNKQDVSYI